MNMHKFKGTYKAIYAVLFMLPYVFINTQIIIPSYFQRILTFLCVGIFCMHVFIRKYSIKILVAVFLCLLIGFISYTLSGASVFLLILLAVIMFRENDAGKIAKIAMSLNIIAVLVVISLSLIGVLDNEKLEIYKSGGFVYRYSLGFNHPNKLRQSLGIIVLCFICTTINKKVGYRVAALIMTVLFYIITGSRTMLISCGIVLFFSVLTRKGDLKFRIKETLIKFRWVFMAAILAFSLGFPALMTVVSGRQRQLLYALNELLSSRLSFSSAVMQYYDLSLFGNTFDFSILEAVFGTYAVDNSFIYVLYGFGIIAMICWIVFSVRAIRILAESDKSIYAILILVLNLWGCIENILFLPNINIGIFLIGAGLTSTKRYKVIRYENLIGINRI